MTSRPFENQNTQSDIGIRIYDGASTTPQKNTGDKMRSEFWQLGRRIVVGLRGLRITCQQCPLDRLSSEDEDDIAQCSDTFLGRCGARQSGHLCGRFLGRRGAGKDSVELSSFDESLLPRGATKVFSLSFDGGCTSQDWAVICFSSFLDWFRPFVSQDLLYKLENCWSVGVSRPTVTLLWLG